MRSKYIENRYWEFDTLKEAVNFYIDEYLTYGAEFQQEDICGWISDISKGKRRPKSDSVGRVMRYRRAEQGDVFCSSRSKSMYIKREPYARRVEQAEMVF